MPKAPNQSTTTTIRFPVSVRLQLERLRVVRAERGYRLPRVKDLVLEGLALLLAKEAPAV